MIIFFIHVHLHHHVSPSFLLLQTPKPRKTKEDSTHKFINPKKQKNIQQHNNKKSSNHKFFKKNLKED